MSVPLVVLTGPTGSGKSAWALRLAEALPVEIVSCDSAQVYRGLDIGTAKPDAATRAQVPHHLIDVRDPTEPWSAGEFAATARAIVPAIAARGRLPVVVGGTMLYLRALLEGLATLPAADPAQRATIDADAAARGWPALHAELARVDPVAAARIGPTDRQRIQRALEVQRTTGRPLTAWHVGGSLGAPSDWTVHRTALVPQRPVLHAALAARLEAMMVAGFLDEVRRLHARDDLHADLPALRAVGYRQLWRHVAGEVPLDVAVASALAATRQLARRQMTWLNGDPGLPRRDPATPGACDGWIDEVRTWPGARAIL
jgi:tRNA dimethylallyltransferase